MLAQTIEVGEIWGDAILLVMLIAMTKVRMNITRTKKVRSL